MTYSSLKTDIQTWAENTGTDFTNQLDTFIDNTQSRLSREIDPTGFNQNVALCGWGSNGIGGNGLVIYFAGSQSSSKVWVQKNANGQHTLNLNAYAPTVGEWFNWVYTSDTSSNQQISYINGKYLSSQTAGAAPGSSGSLRFGASQTSEKGDLNGRMNNLMFYNRALTSEEVRQNFEATKGRYE